MDQQALQKILPIGRELRMLSNDILIAGGAVRNIVTDRPIKDLDIFISDEIWVEKICDKLNLLMWRPPIGGNDPASSGAGEDIADMKVWKCTPGFQCTFSFEVDIILGRKVQDFPDYISQMWLSMYGPAMTPEAQYDLEHCQVRYHSTKLREARLDRLKFLYGTWKFIDLDGTQVSSRSRKGPREFDHAPFWWDMPADEKGLRVRPDTAMAAVRALSEAYRDV